MGWGGRCTSGVTGDLDPPRFRFRDSGDADFEDTIRVAASLVSAAMLRRFPFNLRTTCGRVIDDRSPRVAVFDIFAELDEGRSERVLGLLEGEEAGQVVLTAPKASDVRLRQDTLPRWRISEGRVCA